MPTGIELFRELGGGDWKTAVLELKEAGGRSWSKDLAPHLGVTRDTMSRWARSAGGTGLAKNRRSPNPEMQQRLIALNAARKIAHGVVLGFHPGDDVAVTYDDIMDPRGRHISSSAQVNRHPIGLPPELVDQLEKGDFEAAAETLGNMVMGEYMGLEDGADSPIQPSDYPDGEFE